jgi:hypothetical protein
METRGGANGNPASKEEIRRLYWNAACNYDGLSTEGDIRSTVESFLLAPSFNLVNRSSKSNIVVETGKLYFI